MTDLDDIPDLPPLRVWKRTRNNSDLDRKWKRLEAVSDELRPEVEGRKIPAGEERALEHQRKEIERDLAGEAYKLLQKHGFNGYGQKKGKRKIPGL